MAKRGNSRRPRPDLAYARDVLAVEARALDGLIGRVGRDFADAARMLYGCRGSVVTSGIGKAGIIAGKISATLASTGTPSLFLHAAEAVHGDLASNRKTSFLSFHTAARRPKSQGCWGNSKK